MAEFPYEEIRQEPDGDYFDSIKQMEDKGFQPSQMWSVIHTCDKDQNGKQVNYYTYAPSFIAKTARWPEHHYINLLGYVATKEHHDNSYKAYYDEKFVHEEG